LESRMSESPRSFKSKGRLTAGILLLLIGGISLAINLGLEIPRDWWVYTPWLLVILGALQLSWPGVFGGRLAGYWLVVVGGYGLINVYHLFGLTWVTSWPIFVIALGLRVMLGGLLRRTAV